MTLRMISHDPVHPHQAQCDHNCNQAQCKGLLAVALGAPSEPSGQGFDAQLLHRIMDQVLFRPSSSSSSYHQIHCDHDIVYFRIKHEYFFTSKTIRFDWVIGFVFLSLS